MGVVYECEHVRMGQRMAIKMLLPETVGQPDVVARFEREARASAGLRSRHVARVTDVEETPEGLPYMVMEFLDGTDLDALLEARGRLPVAEAVDYVLQACVAVIEAHDAGIVHRDLKPSNLFLARGPDGVIVKLLDFGISKIVDDASKLTGAESIMGTPLYMSPEQIRSARDVDARTDVWSLGVILFELLSGEPPFNGTTTQVAAAIVTDRTPETLQAHGVRAELEAVVLRAMEKERGRRFQTTRELAAALLPFALPSSTGALAVDATLRSSGHMEQAPISLSPLSSGARPSLDTQFGRTQVDPMPRRSPRVLVGALAGAVLALLVLAAVVAAVAWPRGGRPAPSASASSAGTGALASARSPTSTSASAMNDALAVPSASIASTASSPTAAPSAPVPQRSARPSQGAEPAPPARPTASAKKAPTPSARAPELPNYL